MDIMQGFVRNDLKLTFPPPESPWTEGCPRPCKCKWVGGKRTADCSSAGLTSLPEFARPEQIQVLHLSHNPIGSLEDKVFERRGLINVQKAFLKNCSIAVVNATAFHRLYILIELELSYNNLRTLEPGTFAGNERIRKLWLSHNPLRYKQRRHILADDDCLF